MMPLSPIEQMIDKATGYNPNEHKHAKPPEWKPIVCDGCHNHRRVFISEGKPHRILCTRCLTKKGKP